MSPWHGAVPSYSTAVCTGVGNVNVSQAVTLTMENDEVDMHMPWTTETVHVMT